jgi:hypothetical protein
LADKKRSLIQNQRDAGPIGKNINQVAREREVTENGAGKIMFFIICAVIKRMNYLLKNLDLILPLANPSQLQCKRLMV